MTDTSPDFFSDLSIINDPRSYFDIMRAKNPVQKEPHHGTLMVTGYDAVMEVTRSKDDTFSSAVSVVGPIPPLPFTPSGDDIRDQVDAHREQMPWGSHLACFDGKKHTDYRGVLMALLTPQRVRRNEEYLYGLVDRLIDGFIDKGQCNLVPEYAHAATTYAISDIMGIPEGDRAKLLELIGAPPSQVEGDAVHKVGPDPLIFLKPMFDGYLNERRANPGTDLMSELVGTRLADGSEPDAEVISCLARFLFGAGQDTTSRLITMVVKVLAEDQALQRRIRQEPGRIPDLIEEVLRYDGPVKVGYRLAQRPTTVAGTEVPAGTILTVCLAGASNDPAHFAHPEKVDIDRPNLRDHLAFGKGKHACLGAPLGRLESRVAIERLLARTGEIRLSEQHHGPEGNRHFRFEPTYTFRSLSDLYVEFTPA